MGCEETELCIRVRQRNGRIFVRVATRTGSRKPCYRAFSELATAWLPSGRPTSLVLPVGLARALADVILESDLSGLRRAGAIIAGLEHYAG